MSGGTISTRSPTAMHRANQAPVAPIGIQRHAQHPGLRAQRMSVADHVEEDSHQIERDQPGGSASSIIRNR